MAVDLKQLTRQMFDEVWNKGNVDFLDQFCDASYKGNDPVMGEIDVNGLKQLVRTYRGSFPDIQCSLLSTLLEGEVCVTRWRMTGTQSKPFLGLAPTNKRCTGEGITVTRYRGGKAIEDSTQWDVLGLLRQLGVVSSFQDLLSRAKPAAEQRPHA